MNYRIQAFVLGFLFLLAGGSVLIYIFEVVQNLTSAVAGSVLAFVGLGLILIGALAMFIAPRSLVNSELVTKALSPPVQNLGLILDTVAPHSLGLHVPKLTLGGNSQVLLVMSKETRIPASGSGTPEKELTLAWTPSHRILEPLGIALMNAFETALKRDFLELDTQQLSRLLSRAIVPELQLASGFSLREVADNCVEAVWTKPTIDHTCVSLDEDKGSQHLELCCLCSSVACALAKASGKSVRIEESRKNSANLSVAVTYRILVD